MLFTTFLEDKDVDNLSYLSIPLLHNLRNSQVMIASQKFSLKWNDFKDNVTTAFGSLRDDNNLSDVTLACEDGQEMEAHEVILAASSPFF